MIQTQATLKLLSYEIKRNTNQLILSLGVWDPKLRNTKLDDQLQL